MWFVLGVIAVAYGKQHVAKIGDLQICSDEELIESESDEEALLCNFPTSNPFDDYIENLWKEQLIDLENAMKEGECDTKDYDLAVASTEFLQQAKVYVSISVKKITVVQLHIIIFASM